MCGHVGMAGNLTGNTDKALKQLLIVDTLRGLDSTGIAAVNRHNSDVVVVKQVGHPFELFDMKAFDKAINRQNMVIIGHNRFSTVGNSTRANAHPFDFPGLVGAHNGTLSNKWEFEDGNSFAVDSQALFNHIDKHGVQKAINIAKGAWALVWWDKIEKRINFLRNKERSLYLCESKDGKQIFWASEGWMLSAVLGRNDIQHTTPWLLEENQHYWIELNDKAEFVTEGFEEVKSNAVPFQVGIPVTQHGTRVFQPNQQQSEAPKSFQKADAKAVNGANQGNVAYLNTSRISYAGSKSRTLRVLAERNDHNGATYLSCVDVNEDVKDSIRLYIHVRGNDRSMIGKEIIADISSHAFHNPKHGLYYKVEYSSVRLKTPEIKKEEEDAPVTIRGHDGKELDETHWYCRYTGMCAMCNGDILPTGEYRYTQGGDIICPDCEKDPATQQYVAFI